MISAALLYLSAATASTAQSPLDVAQRQIEIAIGLYYKCVRDNSLRYARGAETADAIAGAVESACVDQVERVHTSTLDFFYIARGDRAFGEDPWRLSKQRLLDNGRREALRWVVEARLKPNDHRR